MYLNIAIHYKTARLFSYIVFLNLCIFKRNIKKLRHNSTNTILLNTYRRVYIFKL